MATQQEHYLKLHWRQRKRTREEAWPAAEGSRTPGEDEEPPTKNARQVPCGGDAAQETKGLVVGEVAWLDLPDVPLMVMFK